MKTSSIYHQLNHSEIGVVCTNLAILGAPPCTLRSLVLWLFDARYGHIMMKYALLNSSMPYGSFGSFLWLFVTVCYRKPWGIDDNPRGYHVYHLFYRKWPMTNMMT